MNILKKVYLTVEGYDLIRKGETVVCGVSGGPDSVAMLHLLRHINDVQGAEWKIHVAHVNHGLRGAESDADEEFVRDLAAKFNLPFHSTRVDVEALRKKERMSLEEAARKLRHRYLKGLALKVDARKIALGHTFDDQAETILHRILRGTGLRGLKGMVPVRVLSRKRELFVVRPLLEVERVEIETYLKEHKIAFRTDQSNFDLSMTRNKIRHTLLPLIEREFNPRFKMALVKLGQTSASFYLVLREIANEVYENTKMLSAEGEVCLSVEEFSKLPPAIQTLIVDRAVRAILGRLPHLNFEHYLEIISLCGQNAFQKSVRLPRGLEVRREGYVIKIARAQAPLPPLRFRQKKVKIPGRTDVQQLNIQIDAEVLEGKILGLKDYIRNKDFTEEIVDFDKVKAPLVVRVRHTGDQFLPLGGRGSTKLKKFFIDNKIPKAVRDRVPILSDSGRIVWVVGYRIGEEVKITENTTRALRLKVRRLQEAPAPS